MKYFGIAIPHADFTSKIWICDEDQLPIKFDSIEELKEYFNYLMFCEVIPQSVLLVYKQSQYKDIRSLSDEDFKNLLIKAGYFTKEGKFNEGISHPS